MPRVKTIRPGRLTGITGLTQEASRELGRQKDIEYVTALSDWQAEKTKLEGIKQDKLNYLDQKMKMIAGEEQAGGATFDEGFKKAQMEQAKEYANIVSDIKLGNIDAADGYAKLAVFDQSLKNIETAIPNINAFNERLQEAMNKEEGEVGSFIYDGSGKTFEIAQLFNDMYSPTKSGNVSTVIEDGKTFLVHKDGQKISIEGLNAIMSGKNPDYPINFVQDPINDLKAVHDAMMKENDSKFKIEYKTEDLDSKGRKVTTKQEKYYIGDNSNYMNYLNRAVEPILNDNEKMKSYWPTIGEGVWTNSDDQREQAQKALAEKGKNLFAPKNDVISKDIGLPKPQTNEPEKAKQSAAKYKNLFTTEVNSAQDILASKNPEDKAKKFMNAINRGIPVKSKDRLQIDEDEKVIFIETPSQFKDQESTFTPIYTFDQIDNLDFENLLIDINTNKKEYGVPTEEFSMLLGDVEQKTPTITRPVFGKGSFIGSPSGSTIIDDGKNLGLNLDTEVAATTVKTNDDIRDLEVGTAVIYKGQERIVFINPDTGKKAITSVELYNKKYKQN
jgi:hypothetical protein